MKNFVAYHKVAEYGPYETNGRTKFHHYSGHSQGKLKKTIGQNVWVISGTKTKEKTIYKLCAVYQPTHIEELSEGGFDVVGNGTAFEPQIKLNGLAWLNNLLKEQQRFSYGLNEIHNSQIIEGLDTLISKLQIAFRLSDQSRFANKLTHKKSFSAIERASEKVARHVFESLLGDKQFIQSCAQLFADSIMLAHQMGEGSWSLTLFPNRIRLNVGPVEVLVLRNDEVFLILDGSENGNFLTGEISPFMSESEVFYPSVPTEQIMCSLPLEKLDDLYSLIAERHQMFIQLAAKRRKKSSWSGSFSPGVITYLNNLLGISLPMPSYYSSKAAQENLFPDEIVTTNTFLEGSVSKVLVNIYERDRNARQQCIEYYGVNGFNCQICGFNFERVYGEIGKGFIHVHHLRPLSKIGNEYRVNPITDLIPICPNCHAMIHRYGLTSIEELKFLISETAQGNHKLV